MHLSNIALPSTISNPLLRTSTLPTLPAPPLRTSPAPAPHPPAKPLMHTINAPPHLKIPPKRRPKTASSTFGNQDKATPTPALRLCVELHQPQRESGIGATCGLWVGAEGVWRDGSGGLVVVRAERLRARWAEVVMERFHVESEDFGGDGNRST